MGMGQAAEVKGEAGSKAHGEDSRGLWRADGQADGQHQGESLQGITTFA